MANFAVIDLGTNTFHLLIVKVNADGSFDELHRERKFIKLGENGVKTIGLAPYRRGLAALIHFRSILNDYDIDAIRVCGTAALRTASNGQAFVKEVKEKINLDISLIDGNEEAKLIYYGVRQAIPFCEEKYLIMDIGGGSVEFIIADKNQSYWAQSFPVGVSVLKNEFHKSEPITEEEIVVLKGYLNEVLLPLKEALQKHELTNLVGASGTFDVLESILISPPSDVLYSEIEVADFHPLYHHFKAMNLEDRISAPQLPSDRADMIVVALVLIDYVLELAKIDKITVSAYAMKEGILAEMIH